MAGYSGGRIKRIKIKDFMTYDYAELYPKKGLNLIVGLNGTGKSSIMCAICLGLAGKPQFTGRATQLSDFIKHGRTEAEVEIELESRKNNVVIHRKLRGEKCQWFLNKKPSNQNEVASTVKKFNIDTSNLCQFLPQEKVAEFSRMDKKQRLENMLQAIGEPHLFELFNELKDLYKKVIEVEQNVKKCQNNKGSAEEENERISDDVQRQESRSRLKEKLSDLLKKRKLVIYQELRNETQEIRRKMKEKKQEYEMLCSQRDEALKEEETICNSYQQCSENHKKFKAERKNLITKLTNNTNCLASFNEQVERETIEFKNKLAERENDRKRLCEVNQLIDGLQKQLEDRLRAYQSNRERDKTISQALSEFQSEISVVHRAIELAIVEVNEVKDHITRLEKQLSLLQNEQTKKMEILRKTDFQTYEATRWLLDNRHKFKSNVYLPIMLEINVNSSEYAKYVENVIALRDMIAFVCEDKSDCELLTDILKRQKRWSVNIVMAPDAPMSRYVVPPLSNSHRQCGLECYVADLFTAPEPIKKYLYQCYNIHRIPVTKSAINPNSIEFILNSYRLFFAENMRISGKRSKYGQKKLSKMNDAIVAKNLLINHNDLQQQVEQKIQEIQEMRNLLTAKNSEYEARQAQLTEKEKYQDKLRQEKKSFQDLRRHIETLKMNILQKQRFCEKISTVFDEEEEKRKITRKIQSINENRHAVLSEINSLFQDFMQIEREIVKLILHMNCLSKNLKLNRSAHEGVHDQVKAAEAELQKVSEIFYEKRASAKNLIEEIKGFGGDFVKYIQDSNIVLDSSMDKEKIEESISHVQAQLNLNEDNEPLVAEYYARKQKIETIQRQIDGLEGNLERTRQIMDEKRKEWLEPLQRHINNINQKFSRYFKVLSCAGEINLDIPENIEDFAKYGLQIKLQFHKDEPFTELSHNHHSGGECSVAAIVFILSLQELTEVPFRCIDEINQGMDSVNERKIYHLIADSVREDNCSQYFLLTPKLVDDMEYSEDMVVHIIFNSPFLTTKLDIEKHVQIAKAL